MKNKKLVIWLVILLVSLLVITSCGSKDDPIKDPEPEVEDNQEEEIVEEKPEEVEVEEEEEEEKPDTVYVDERVLLDEEDIKIKLTGIYGHEITGPYFTLQIENNSEEDIMVQTELLSINNIMISPFFSEKVAAGEKVDAELEFYTNDLDDASIFMIKDVEFKFHILEDGSFDTILMSDLIEIQVKNTDDYVQSYNFAGELVEDGEFRIFVGKLIETDFGEPALEVLVENTSNKDINVHSGFSDVNGVSIYANYSTDIAAGKLSYRIMIFDEDDIEENEIGVINEVVTYFVVSDLETGEFLFETDDIVLEF